MMESDEEDEADEDQEFPVEISKQELVTAVRWEIVMNKQKIFDWITKSIFN